MDFDALLRDYQGAAPGAALAVLEREGPPWVHLTGRARLEADDAAIHAATSFRLASLTKAFTAKAVALLDQAGDLELATPVRDVFPALSDWPDDIRIGHLVAHTSGVPDYESLVPPDRTAQLDDGDVLGLIAGATPPPSPAGSRFAYDNGGYVLLGLAVEVATGRSLGEFLHDRIFRPLGMNSTVLHVEGRTAVRDRALGYRREGEGWTVADQGVTTATRGDGGIYSCLDDLACWDAALRRPGYPPDPARLAPYAAPVAPGVAYGWGWYLDAFRGRRRQRHDGWSTGFQNEIQRYPDEGVTVVVLTNRAEPPVRAVAEAIASRRW